MGTKVSQVPALFLILEEATRFLGRAHNSLLGEAKGAGRKERSW